MNTTQSDVTTVIERLRELRQDLLDHPQDWENHTLSDYLESLQAWLEDTRERVPAEPSWDFIANLLGAGKIYE